MRRSNMKMERKNKIGKQIKTLSFDTKELQYNENSRVISGYAAIYNNIDKSRDMLLKGCFSKSIQERGPESTANDKIIMLWMHDMKEPIGRITRLVEDDKGLYFEAEIDEVERGEQTIRQLKSGTLNQFSIGYSYVWDNCEWDSNKDCLIVKEVILYEISVVSIGCNPETEFMGMKTCEEYEDAVEILSREIDEACKGLPVRKKEELQNVIRKAMSLASYKPAKEPLHTEQADNKERIKLFSTSLKLKEA